MVVPIASSKVIIGKTDPKDKRSARSNLEYSQNSLFGPANYTYIEVLVRYGDFSGIASRGK